MRITGFVLADEDVSAPGPSEETGAGVPGYSGGLAAAPDVSRNVFANVFANVSLNNFLCGGATAGSEFTC